MRVVALGGGSEVGASCLFIEIDNCRLLVDAGIRVGGRYGGEDDVLPDLALLSEFGGIDAVVVTHAHLDHIGALPLVHQVYPEVQILATVPTVHLMRVMLADAIKLMETRAEREMEVPLYNADLVGRMFTWVRGIPYGRTVVIKEIGVTLYPAGHILGAAMVGIEGKEGTLLISGDISLRGQRTIPGLTLPPFRPHVLVLESTYGNRLHANRQREEDGLARTVAEVIGAGGHVLIPAFALGRAQEVILLLQAYQQRNLIPRFPIWVDGLIRSINQTYLNFPDYLNGPVKRAINSGGNPFYFDRATCRPVENSSRREKILAGSPACIIASSGMLSGGPSQFYAARLVEDERHAILLCGYQDEESPGHRLLALAGGEERELVLDQQVLTVRCRVEKYGLSAHADMNELIALVEQIKPRRVLLVHGEEEARVNLAARMAATRAVICPANGEEVIFLPFRRGSTAAVTAGITTVTPLKKDDELSTPRECAPAGTQKGWDGNSTHSGIGFGRLPQADELWQYLINQGYSGHLFTVQELAEIWFGEAPTPAQQEEMAVLLAGSGQYFASDWKYPYFYRPRRPEVVAAEQRRRRLMEGLQHLPGHLVLVRDGAGQLRAGICYYIKTDGFECFKVGQVGTFHPAESLLTIVAPWDFGSCPPQPAEEKARLNYLLRQTRSRLRLLKAQDLYHLLVEAGRPLSITEIIRFLNGEDDMANRLAVAWLLHAYPDSFKVQETGNGFNLYTTSTTLPLPSTLADTVLTTDRLEQNAALALVEEMLPPEAGLYRKGINREAGKIILYFYFPLVVKEKYACILEQLAGVSGWEVEVHPETHQGALATKVGELLPGWMLEKTPSIYREEGLVLVRARPPALTEPAEAETSFREAAAEFYRQTGFALEWAQSKPQVGQLSVISPETKFTAVGSGSPMEINRAYDLIKRHFKARGVNIYRTGKKRNAEQEYIEITFISPQIGERYREELQRLAAETGWPLAINPEPNQFAINNLAKELLSPQWGLAREPAFYRDRLLVVVKLTTPPADDDPQWLAVQREFQERTGYSLDKTKA